MKITYYTNGKIEILVMKDDDGKVIKKGLYTIIYNRKLFNRYAVR